LVDSLRRQLPVDAVLLALHGALVVDEVPDVEGEVLIALRDVIGPNVPLVVTLDLHANITERMIRAADALVLYHTAPHIDVFETGQRGAAVLRRILVDGAKPITAFQKMPLVVPAERANTQDAASISYALREQLQALEREPRILSAGLATVQPWLDIPELGSSVVLVTDGDDELARRCGAEISAEVWRRRRDYLPELVLWPTGYAPLTRMRKDWWCSATAPTPRPRGRRAIATGCCANCSSTTGRVRPW
jgi:microcystin degradation protein MlrC